MLISLIYLFISCIFIYFFLLYLNLFIYFNYVSLYFLVVVLFCLIPSDAPKQCFKSLYSADKNDTCDYFSCGQCQLNCMLASFSIDCFLYWSLGLQFFPFPCLFQLLICIFSYYSFVISWIARSILGLCKSCSEVCHKGHKNVTATMLHHKATWACCYCSKKGHACQLIGKWLQKLRKKK
jgi:hypothetical protein